jgi:hypothetical protein
LLTSQWADRPSSAGGLEQFDRVAGRIVDHRICEPPTGCEDRAREEHGGMADVIPQLPRDNAYGAETPLMFAISPRSAWR